MTAAIADTGPIVALLDRTDAHHAWALHTFKALRSPLLTCEAVLAEAYYLLSRSGTARTTLAELYSRGIIRIAFDFEAEAGAAWRLLQKYADVPMDFADACIVRMSELHSDSVVWTLDSDFAVYRRHTGHSIQLLTPR
jgi:predicted nucleic acid-binding protein